MPVYIFPKGALISLNSTDLSDHGRSALQISPDVMKTDVRLANGSLRRYFVATKEKFSFSWSFLPALDADTADGKAGRNSIKGIYTNNIGLPITLTYKAADSSNIEQSVSLTVFIDTYTESLLKRWNTQYWDCSITLVEQ